MRRFDPREFARNVLGEPLQDCSVSPMTGFYLEDLKKHAIDLS